jgi:hypothetical protein
MTMISVLDAIEKCQFGDTSKFNNLSMIPVLTLDPQGTDYILLDDALAMGLAEVSEVSGEGSVPELLFKNKGKSPVLLVDGEELLGAKQNRVLNLTIMAPAQSDIRIPVSCVESGRWSRKSEHFSSSPRTMYSRGRAKKMDYVSQSLRSSGERYSDQRKVWDDISEKSSRMEAKSETGAMEEIFKKHQVRIEDFIREISLQKNQIGAIFGIDGEIAGMDCFEEPGVFEKIFPKLLRSYALDAIDSSWPAEREIDKAFAYTFVNSISRATFESYPAVGMGEDYRFRNQEVSGAALVVNESPVHVCAFPVRDIATNPRPRRNMDRASNRGRRRN